MDTTLSRDWAEITNGHWVFAALFALAFIVFLFFAYRKDAETHKAFKLGGGKVLLFVIMIIVLVFIFKRAFF